MTGIPVLVIDDEPRLRENLAKLLGREGYRVPSVPFAPNATLAEVEREWIRLTLERCGGNQSAAAGLGIDRTTLYRRLRQNGGETRSILQPEILERDPKVR